MARADRCFLVSVTITALLVLTISAQTSKPRPERGEEWLSWTPAERNTYLVGFITGYRMGSHDACENTDRLFETNRPHRLYENPSARCEARLEDYSSTNFPAYAAVITEFYTEHPEYRGIPYPYLLKFESNSQHKTASQLYHMAVNGELRTNF